MDLKFCVSIGGFLRDCILVFKGFPGGTEVKASACKVGDLGSIPGSGRSPGEGNGNPLQYSCLENPVDGGLQTVDLVGYSPQVAKSQIRLSDFIFTFTLMRTARFICVCFNSVFCVVIFDGHFALSGHHLV